MIKNQDEVQFLAEYAFEFAWNSWKSVNKAEVMFNILTKSHFEKHVYSDRTVLIVVYPQLNSLLYWFKLRFVVYHDSQDVDFRVDNYYIYSATGKKLLLSRNRYALPTTTKTDLLECLRKNSSLC